jgi:hypothetical protein
METHTDDRAQHDTKSTGTGGSCCDPGCCAHDARHGQQGSREREEDRRAQRRVAISGETIAITASEEDSSSAADPTDNSAFESGALYVIR